MAWLILTGWILTGFIAAFIIRKCDAEPIPLIVWCILILLGPALLFVVAVAYLCEKKI